jgi:hypothetical protein
MDAGGAIEVLPVFPFLFTRFMLRNTTFQDEKTS